MCLPDKNLAHPGITLVQNDISAIYNALFILSTNSFTVQCFFISSFGIVWSSEAINYTKINIEITKISRIIYPGVWRIHKQNDLKHRCFIINRFVMWSTADLYLFKCTENFMVSQIARRQPHDGVITWNDFPVTGLLWCKSMGTSPDKGPVMRNFDFFFSLIRNNLLSKRRSCGDLRHHDAPMMSLL